MKKKILTHLLFAYLIICLTALTSCDRGRNTEVVVGFPQSFADVAQKVQPAVVNISTEKTVKIPGSPFGHFFGPNDPFRDFFDIPEREMRQKSLGSGFIVDKTGYIITNNHVVEGAEEITVKLADGRQLKAKVVGRDPKTDLALIRIASMFKDLPALQLGDSSTMRVGDWVLAIGNPFGLEHTVTQGIISGSGRAIGAGPYDDFLQTDAAINPGNSGGPLVNLKGEVVGINTAIVAGGQGIGFAIPSNMASGILTQLRDKGRVTRGWIGISVQKITPELAESFGLKEPGGALVAEVMRGGPAESAGIRRGDVIVGFGGKAVREAEDLPTLVAASPLGKVAEVVIIREAKQMRLQIVVAEMPEEKLSSAGQGKIA